MTREDRTDASPDRGDPKDEDDGERLAREHQEMFHELRAVIPGAQVLVAFLLTVAFTPRFEDLGTGDRVVFLATFLLAATALVLLLAPTAYHRVQFRQGDKDAMLRTANAEALVAMVLLGSSLSGVTYLVGNVVFDATIAVVSAASLWVLSLVAWWVVPVVRRVRTS